MWFGRLVPGRAREVLPEHVLPLLGQHQVHAPVVVGVADPLDEPGRLGPVHQLADCVVFHKQQFGNVSNSGSLRTEKTANRQQ